MIELITNNWIVDILGIMISFILMIGIVTTTWMMLKAFRSGQKIHSISLAPWKFAVTFEDK